MHSVKYKSELFQAARTFATVQVVFKPHHKDYMMLFSGVTDGLASLTLLVKFLPVGLVGAQLCKTLLLDHSES